MGITVKRPILVAGITISFALWFWESFDRQILALGEWGLMGVIAVGSGFWWWQGQREVRMQHTEVRRLTAQAVQEKISQGELTLNVLAKEAPDVDLSGLKTQFNQLSGGFERQALTVAITGGKSVGKTALKDILAQQNLSNQITWIETEALFKDPESPEIKADLILVLITGDLTNSQWEFLRKCYQNHQRFLLIFNKQDHYLPEEKVLIVAQLRQRVEPMIESSDLISISASPQGLKVRRHEENGTVKEWTQPQSPQIEQLSDRLKVLLETERETLVWGSIWREAITLKQQAKGILNDIRRDRALPIIEQFQWIAAATAFANPVAALDLLATAAISSQMILDLGGIYQQKLSLSQGQTIAGTIGQLMVKLGLVELSTQTISSLLKSNALTYVAGGTIQGVSAAYLTRLAGLSLVAYFQEQEINPSSSEGIDLAKLSEKLKQVFEQNKRTVLLQNLIKQALPRFSTQA